MKNSLNQLWYDLREKRLWPVALVLLLALIAIPVALSKSAEEPPAPSPAPTSTTAPAGELEEFKGLASVTLEEPELGVGSTLDTFDPSNPFRPPAAVVKRSTQPEASAEGPGPSSAPEETPAPESGSGGGGGQTTDDGDDTSGGDDTGPQEQTKQYAYAIDVTFWNNGRRREIRGMQKLDQLPNAATPVLIFMGATENGGNAVFLVDSTLETTGEGACKPSRADCAFLYVGAGSEQEFTNDDGDSYRLRIDQIRKVKVGGDDPSTKPAKNGKTARAAVGAPDEVRRFVPPVLVDLVVETTLGDGNSTGATKRR